MVDRYVPNGTRLTPYEAELLTILMEECAEVIVGASKLIRFGKENRPTDGESNTAHLSMEFGHLECMMQRARLCGLIDTNASMTARFAKEDKLERYMQTEPPQ